MITSGDDYEDPFRAHLRQRHRWTEEKLDAIMRGFERAHSNAHETEDAGHPAGELEVPHGVRYRPPAPEIRNALGSFAEERDDT